MAACAMFNFVLAPSDFDTISRIPANSRTARTEPPAIIPVPAGAGLMITLAAPLLAIASCATVRPSIRGIFMIFLFAAWIAFLIASGTSAALPIPRPTLPFLSPFGLILLFLN